MEITEYQGMNIEVRKEETRKLVPRQTRDKSDGKGLCSPFPSPHNPLYAPQRQPENMEIMIDYGFWLKYSTHGKSSPNNNV